MSVLFVEETVSPPSTQYRHLLWGTTHYVQCSHIPGAGLVPEGMDSSLQITTHLLQLIHQTAPAGGEERERGRGKRKSERVKEREEGTTHIHVTRTTRGREKGGVSSVEPMICET